MVEVEVLGFQSIEHAKFKIDGFTVLVGRSNIGKSAVVRAIQCALTGATGTDFVRHGPDCDRRKRKVKKCKCFSQVLIKTSSLQITWEKGDAVNRYVVLKAGENEPTVYDKIGRGVPEFLQPEFSPVKVGDSQNLVQVSEQFNPIFLLDQSGPAVADVLSDVARLDQINGAIRLVEKDRKADVATRKVREKDILSINKSLKSYDGLDDVVEGVGRVERLHKSVQGASDALDALERFLGKAQTLNASLKALKAAVAPPVPDGSRLEKVARRATRADRFFDSLSAKAGRVRKLRGVSGITLPDASPVNKSLSKVRRLDSWIREIQDLKTVLKRRGSVEDRPLPDTGDVKKALSKVLEIQGLLDRMNHLEAHCKRTTERLAEAVSEEREVLGKIQDLGVCPTCSQRIEIDRCLHLEGS